MGRKEEYGDRAARRKRAKRKGIEMRRQRDLYRGKSVETSERNRGNYKDECTEEEKLKSEKKKKMKNREKNRCKHIKNDC